MTSYIPECPIASILATTSPFCARPPFNTSKTQARTQIRTERSEDGDRVGYKGYVDIFGDFLEFLRREQSGLRHPSCAYSLCARARPMNSSWTLTAGLPSCGCRWIDFPSGCITRHLVLSFR